MRFVVAMLCVALIAGCTKATLRPAASSSHAVASSLPGDVAHGETVFLNNCATCHGQRGAGGGIGPVLTGERSRKNYAAAVSWIEDPGAGAMPKLYPAQLSETDVHDVAAYVETL